MELQRERRGMTRCLIYLKHAETIEFLLPTWRLPKHFFPLLNAVRFVFCFFPTLCAFIPGRSKRDIRNVININMLISDCMLINSHVNVTMIVCCIYSHCCIVNINIVLLYHWQPEDFGSCRSVLTFLLSHLQIFDAFY